MDKVNTQVFKIADLNPAKYNPRKALKPGDPEFEHLVKSIQNFGYVEYIVVNAKNNNTVISGHQRLAALKYLGETEVECIVVELDEPEEKALNIAMNKISGEWDVDKLKDLLKDLDLSGLDMELTGFDEEELQKLIGEVRITDDDDFDVDAELAKPTFSMAGDIWHLGDHIVICADATDPDSYAKLMGGVKANMVLTDPPYGVDVEETAGKIQNDNLADDEFYSFLYSAFSQMHEHLADDGSIYVWHADTKGLIFRKAYKDAGFYLSGCCIWKKNALVLGRSPYQWQHEPCLYGWKAEGKHQWYSDRKQTTIWEYDRPKSNPDHPTMKPVPLMSYPIQNSTMTNGIILDPFLGSGSTLIACCETDRVCRGIELDPRFMDVIVKRFIAWNDGNTDDVYVERDGNKIPYSDVPKQEDEE